MQKQVVCGARPKKRRTRNARKRRLGGVRSESFFTSGSGSRRGASLWSTLALIEEQLDAMTQRRDDLLAVTDRMIDGINTLENGYKKVHYDNENLEERIAAVQARIARCQDYERQADMILPLVG